MAFDQIRLEAPGLPPCDVLGEWRNFTVKMHEQAVVETVMSS